MHGNNGKSIEAARGNGPASSARAPRRRNASSKKSEGNAARAGGGEGEAVSVGIGDLPVITSKRWYITASVAIAIIGSIVSATYFAIDYGRIRPIEKELENNRGLLASAKTDALTFKAQLERAEQKNTALAALLVRPGLIFPQDRSSIVGSNITFLWEYPKHDPSTTKYILELQEIGKAREPLKINVDRPETKSMFFAFDRAAAGSYLWRVRPGLMVSDKEVGQGPWSNPAVFTVYPNVTDRIRATGKVLVATTPTSYDPFVGINRKGEYKGFELKLVRWLMPRLAEKLKLSQVPAPEISEIPWNRLFTYMQQGQADIAVRSITRSDLREREYQNLKFTVGYVLNHQIFIALSKDDKYPDALKGRIVGVKSRSVNEEAAKFLAPKFGFSINSSYTAYGDLLEGLRRGEIAYALVDSSLVNDRLGKDIYALGGYLDDELRDYYTRELGFDHEEYSILVHDGGSSELRLALDEILRSTEYKTFAIDNHVEVPSH